MVGQVIPGTSFIVFGLWWTVTTLVNYRRSQSTSDGFISSIMFDCLAGKGKCWNAPWGGILKIVATVAGIVYEIQDSVMDETLDFIDTNMLQHVTMYAFFWLTGVLDVLVYFRLPFPPAVEHVAVSFALVVEGLLFCNHFTGRGKVDVIVHVLLVTVILTSVVVVVAEIKYRHSVWLALLRSFLTLLQGTWFWQASYTLNGDVDWFYQDKNFKLIALYFCWHIGVDLILMLLIGGLIHWVMGKLYHHFPPTSALVNDITEDSELNTVNSRNRESYTSEL